MLPTIEFDDELCVRAAEIDNEAVQRHLASEFPATEPAVSKPKPKDALGIGLMIPQPTRGLHC
jgi:hypothetical protein